MAEVGHNSFSAELLESTVADLERLIEQRKAVSEQIKEALDGAQGQGLDKKTIREMLKLRKLEKSDRDEAEMLRDLYSISLGLNA